MKKAVSVIAFVIIAMATGAMVSYEMNSKSLDVKGAEQVEFGNTAQEGEENVVETDETVFTCQVSGCVQTTAHLHGLCGIDGCTQIGEHSHGRCDMAGCTETGVHIHNGVYCYPHSADDGHAYHNCGVAGCTLTESHTHNCGVAGCTLTESHTHSCGNHHQSGHGRNHH